MIKVDLVTGFLGSGKTTFIKKYVSYLTAKGYKVGIIENDFGAINIDMLMLQDMLGEKCDIEQIVGGTVVTDWKRRFRTKLISMAMRGFQRIVVEPSGIYDVDAFFDVIYDDPIEQWYEVGNVFAITDAIPTPDMAEQEEYLMVSQLANAGKIIFSKVENADITALSARKIELQNLLEKYQCNRMLQEEDLLWSNWEELTVAGWEKLEQCGYRKADHRKLWFDSTKVFQSVFMMESHLEEAKLPLFLEKVFHNAACGEVFRVKGYLRVSEDEWLEFNATIEHCSVRKVPQGQDVFIVIGRDLSEEKIRDLIN